MKTYRFDDFFEEAKKGGAVFNQTIEGEDFYFISAGDVKEFCENLSQQQFDKGVKSGEKEGFKKGWTACQKGQKITAKIKYNYQEIMEVIKKFNEYLT